MIHSIRLKNRWDIFKEDLTNIPEKDLIHTIDKRGNWLLMPKEEIDQWKNADNSFYQLEMKLIFGSQGHNPLNN